MVLEEDAHIVNSPVLTIDPHPWALWRRTGVLPTHQPRLTRLDVIINHELATKASLRGLTTTVSQVAAGVPGSLVANRDRRESRRRGEHVLRCARATHHCVDAATHLSTTTERITHGGENDPSRRDVLDPLWRRP